ncbi:hypothetical protein BVX99_02065 [bacterium F16]|nr:hypothetical protein BVX99_02065 [bacterium F16]
MLLIVFPYYHFLIDLLPPVQTLLHQLRARKEECVLVCLGEEDCPSVTPGYTTLFVGDVNLPHFCVSSEKECEDYSAKLHEVLAAHSITQFDAVIVFDPHGAALACSFLQQYPDLPIGFISLEIMFTEELLLPEEHMTKRLQDMVLSRITCALVQDKERGILLVENSPLSTTQLYYSPVAPVAYTHTHLSQAELRTKYGLPLDKRLLLYSGALSELSRLEWFLELTHYLPLNYLLVLTIWNKKPNSLAVQRAYKMLSRRENVHFTEEIIPSVDYLDYCRSFDAGLALFRGTYVGWNFGKNMDFIGLASGKFSSYICSGLPVITSNQSVYRNLSKQYSCVLPIAEPEEIFQRLNALPNKEEYKDETSRMYSEVLDPEPGLIAFLDELLSKRTSCELRKQVALQSKTVTPVLSREALCVHSYIQLKLDFWEMTESISNLAVVGAGKHTCWLLQQFGNHPFLRKISIILDDSPQLDSICGLPVSKETGNDVDAFLLSSDTICDALRGTVQQRYHNPHILELYDGLPPGPYLKS